MSYDASTVASLFTSCRTAYNPELSLPLLLGDLALDVLSNSQALLDDLKSYFRDFLRPSGDAMVKVMAIEAAAEDFGLSYLTKEPDPGKSKIKEEWAALPDGRVVRKRLTGMIFAFGGGNNLAFGPCVANPNQVVNFINNRLIEMKLKEGCLLGHAAGVSWQGKGMALAGFSGMGKSTLALHLMNHGLTFVSNDRLMIRPEGEGVVMYGVAKMPRINPGTIVNNPALTRILTPEEHKQFAAMPVEELWSLEHKFDAMIDECYGPGRFDLKADMASLVLLNWKRDGGAVGVAQVDIEARRDLLPAFMKGTGLFFEDDEDHPTDFSEAAYVEMLRRVKVYEVTGGADFLEAAKVLSDMLKA